MVTSIRESKHHEGIIGNHWESSYINNIVLISKIIEISEKMLMGKVVTIRFWGFQDLSGTKPFYSYGKSGHVAVGGRAFGRQLHVVLENPSFIHFDDCQIWIILPNLGHFLI